MKKLVLLLTCISTLTLSLINPFTCYAMEYNSIDDPEFYEQPDIDSEYFEYLEEKEKEAYEVAIDDLDNLPAICQFEEEIYNHKNTKGKKWTSKACVATSLSLMILRKAYIEGYDYDGDSNEMLSKDAAIDVLQTISNENSLFMQSSRDLIWHGNCFVDILTKDNEEFYVELEPHTSSEDTLKELLASHPEGVLVYGRHNSWYHGVLVTKDLEEEGYEVYDSAEGIIEIRDYKHLNNSFNKTYKFVTLKEFEETDLYKELVKEQFGEENDDPMYDEEIKKIEVARNN